MIEITLMIGDDIIFIVKDKINNINLFDDLFDNYLKNNKIFIQLFSISNLVINISKHVLVPFHRIISDDEKEELLKKYNLDSYNQLPSIERTDAAGKFYGMKPGDICEIKRPRRLVFIIIIDICYKSFSNCSSKYNVLS